MAESTEQQLNDLPGYYDNKSSYGSQPDARLLGFYNTLRVRDIAGTGKTGQRWAGTNANTGFREEVQVSVPSFRDLKEQVAWNVAQDKESFGNTQTDKDILDSWSKLAFGEEAKVPHAPDEGDDEHGDDEPTRYKQEKDIGLAEAMDLPEKYYRDTSVGGNDVINPLWQFSEDDDIVHPQSAFKLNQDADGVRRGLGRVYYEMYEQNQWQLEMTFGVPHYLGAAAAVNNNTSKTLHELNQAGDTSIATKLSAAVAQGTGLAVNIVTWPVRQLWNLATEGSRSHVNKYVEFEASMYHYFRKVNTILASLAQGMGLTPDMSDYKEVSEEGKKHKKNQWKSYFREPPEIIRYNIDIFKLIQKRSQMVAGTGVENREDIPDQDAVLNAIGNGDALHADEKISDDKNTWGELMEWIAKTIKKGWGVLTTVTTRFIGASKGNLNFVRFRVTDMNSEESFSNQTGESPVGQKLKEASKEGQQSSMQAKLPGIGALQDMVNTVKNAADVASDFIMPGEGVLAAASGKGMFDIPEMWTDSSFSKSYSFTLQLRSPYGDPVSIFQSLYVPLAMLLAGALPRSAGTNMYTSPFMLRAYCKGQFSIPYGIIESLSVKRGGEEFGWTQHGLPRAIDLELSIKDLTPVVFMGVSDRKLFDLGALLNGKNPLNFLEANDAFQEYMDTLCGLGVSERYCFDKMAIRRLKINASIWSKKFGSTSYISNKVALGGLGQTFAGLVGWSNTPFMSTA